MEFGSARFRCHLDENQRLSVIPAMITQMRVKGLIFDPYNNAYIVVLRDEDNADMLPIWVGKSEASAIGLAIENVTAPRPMTHDLMKSFLGRV